MASEDTDWNLTLVNRWNPLPEKYDIDLVEVPGGEKVDKRIYEPLMEMLEAAKEGQLESASCGSIGLSHTGKTAGTL